PLCRGRRLETELRGAAQTRTCPAEYASSAGLQHGKLDRRAADDVAAAVADSHVHAEVSAPANERRTQEPEVLDDQARRRADAADRDRRPAGREPHGAVDRGGSAWRRR